MADHGATFEPGDPTASRGLSRLRAWRYDLELRGLAPHVEGPWAEAFVVELRLRDVPGRAIGEALAEVESHCAESGESATEAFGDPVAYAAGLELRTGADVVGRPFSFESMARWLLQAVGLLVVLMSAGAWQEGEPLGVTSGLLVIGVVLLVTVVVLSRHAERATRFVVERTGVALVLALVHLGVLIALLVVLDDVVVRIPAVPALLVGAALLTVGSVAVARDLQRGSIADQPVTGPLDSDDEVPAAFARTTTRVQYAPALVLPVLAVAVVVGTFLGG